MTASPKIEGKIILSIFLVYPILINVLLIYVYFVSSTLSMTFRRFGDGEKPIFIEKKMHIIFDIHLRVSSS